MTNTIHVTIKPENETQQYAVTTAVTSRSAQGPFDRLTASRYLGREGTLGREGMLGREGATGATGAGRAAGGMGREAGAVGALLPGRGGARGCGLRAGAEGREEGAAGADGASGCRV